MDRNRVRSITNITDDLHDKVDKIYEDILDENFKDAEESIDSMNESLKQLKQNLKVDEI